MVDILKFKKMNSFDKRNRIYISIIAGLAVVITLVSLIIDSHNIFPLIVFIIAALTNNLKLIHRIIFLGIITIIAFPIILLIGHLLPKENFSDPHFVLNQYLVTLYCSAPAVAIVVVIAYFLYTQTLETALNQKKHNEIIGKFPYLICRKHLTRTKEYSTLGYKSVSCRIGKRCLRKADIQHTVNLVGLIGMIENGKTVSNDYFVTLWDHRYRKIRYGDYDIIEIHESNEMKDYDFVISKIITFFYNEINRFKPLREVTLRIVGNPPISENTKRMMHKHFLNVEYISA